MGSRLSALLVVKQIGKVGDGEVFDTGNELKFQSLKKEIVLMLYVEPFL